MEKRLPYRGQGGKIGGMKGKEEMERKRDHRRWGKLGEIPGSVKGAGNRTSKKRNRENAGMRRLWPRVSGLCMPKLWGGEASGLQLQKSCM